MKTIKFVCSDQNQKKFASAVRKSIAVPCICWEAEQVYILKMGRSINPGYPANNLFLKMQRRLLYEHALTIIPDVIKESIERAGVSIKKTGQLLNHQANMKMMV